MNIKSYSLLINICREVKLVLTYTYYIVRYPSPKESIYMKKYIFLILPYNYIFFSW